MRDDEARLAEWRRRGREMGLELAAAAKRAIEAGELVEVCARTLAETTVCLAGECASAGAARDEVVVYVNELSASFGDAIEATGSAAASQLIPEVRAEPAPSPARSTSSVPSPSRGSRKDQSHRRGEIGARDEQP